MKVSTLACDLCKGVVPAVVTLSLTSDDTPRKGDPAIDVCKGHLAELRAAFTPRKRGKLKTALGRARVRSTQARLAGVQAKRERERERHQQNAPTKRDAARAFIDHAILAAIPMGERTARDAILKRTKLTVAVYAKGINRLVEQGFVEAYGPKSKMRRYERTVRGDRWEANQKTIPASNASSPQG